MTDVRHIQGGDSWPGGVSDGLTLPCGICGSEPEVDYTVTDDFWAAWVPERHRLGVVCLPCLDALCHGDGLAGALVRMQWTGSGHTVVLEPVQRWTYEKGLRRTRCQHCGRIRGQLETCPHCGMGEL